MTEACITATRTFSRMPHNRISSALGPSEGLRRCSLIRWCAPLALPSLASASHRSRSSSLGQRSSLLRTHTSPKMAADPYAPLSSNEEFPLPSSVCLSPSMHLFFACDNRVLLHKFQKTEIHVFCGSKEAGNATGGRFEARFKEIAGLCLSADGELLIADSGNHCIKIVKKDGSVVVYAGTGVAGCDNGPKDKATFNSPSGLCLDHNGDLIVADTKNHVIRKVSQVSGEVTTLAGTGTPG